jgi:transcriptional regulator with GAF, ATPase, and Fis domain
MPVDDETRDDSQRMPDPPATPQPGVVIVFAAGRPAALAFEVGAAGIEFGRGVPTGALEEDDRVSRLHVRVTRQSAGVWKVDDLASRNGTFVSGRRLESSDVFSSPVLVRIGRSLLWVVDDVRPFLDSSSPADSADAAGPVIGGALRRALGEIVLASQAGDTVFIRGESGAGKELAARAFHEARHGAASSAPFVAVNCAAIPEGLAERLLFGARKGAYSGATADADGYIQAADGGTLFLDEVAELDALVQAKLLRVLENREVLPLGAARPRKVTLTVCVASHKGLRDEVAAGRFREDLYYRIGRPEIRVPALRDRIDEVPRFIEREIRRVDPRLSASVAFVEACALRAWPGNVRELIGEARSAAHRALQTGGLVLEPEHLSRDAGAHLSSRPPEGDRSAKGPAPSWTDEAVRKALAEHDGNVRGTARALGMHRNQLRRWLAKHAGTTPEPDDSES